jgi:hypothetical protein
MAMVPVICDNCGAVWGAPNVIGDSGARIAMTRTKVGPCPACGGVGSVPDGVYDLLDDTVSVVQSAQISASTLQGLIDLLRARARGQITDDEVIEKVESTAPALLSAVQNVLQKQNPMQWVTLLLAIFGMYLQLQAREPPTAEDIVRALHENPAPALVAPQKSNATHGRNRVKRKRPPKTHGKGKKRSSKKRR